MDSKLFAKIHWNELQAFLASHPTKGMQTYHSCMCEPFVFSYLYVHQNPQTHAPPRARSLPDSQGSNSRSYPQMYTMNSSGALQALKVSFSFAIARHPDRGDWYSATPTQQG
jgi:hypothetical protein